MDSKRVLEVLQTLNVDVKNHMSTIDQKTAEKVTEAVKRAPAKQGDSGSKEVAKATRQSSKPVREANPAKASLLEDFFGAGARPRRSVEDVKRQMRSATAERPPAERRSRSAERPAAEAPPRPAARSEVPKRPEEPRAEAKPKAEGAREGAPAAKLKAEAGKVDLPKGPAAEQAGGKGKAQQKDVGEGAPARNLPKGPGADRDRPRVEAGPRPGRSGIGLPTKPLPKGSVADADRAAIEAGPRPRGSGIGLPTKPARGGDRGPRPGGGFGGRGRGRRGGLAIPKVDPKVAEQAKPAEGKPRVGQGGDRKRGDFFDRRENDPSRPSEEKLFGRRPKKSKKPERRVVKSITIEGPMTVKELAHEMGVTAAEVIKTLLTQFGIMATINQELDTDTCVLVGSEFGAEVTVKEVEDILEKYDQVEDPDEDPALKKPRHPVVTIMGHVDHGKTSLLDAIRESRVAAGEAGGITQHIGAYEVELDGKHITFLDTPGHEAFTAMRARGANVTDIAILVVAADDSVMPQTIESINHAKAANVPIIVAINKIDKPDANPERVKQDLTAHGLIPEEWGGDTIMVPVSAKNKQNLDLLLENILILAEILELKANPDKEARGTILEAQLDKTRGPVATVLVQAGTLHPGDCFVAGTAWGRVRAMFDHRGRKVKSAGPSTPVQILGFQSVPNAGDIFRVTPDEKEARNVAERRQQLIQAERQKTKAMSLDDFMSKVAEGEMKDLNLIIKADVQGSVKALRGQLEKLRNEEVQVKIIHAAVGAITETDVMLASTANAVIIGFNVRPDDRATRAAAEQGVDIRTYNVIYNVIDDIEAAMKGMLAPKIEEVILGRAEVRELFKVPKVGMAAGCVVVSGKVTRHAKYRLIRDGVVVWEGNLNQLRRFKDEVKEVAEGYECGITLERFQDFKPGDILEAYELREVKAG